MAAQKSALQRTCFFIATSFAWTIPQLASAEPMNRVVVLNEGYDRTVNDALLVESTVTLVRSKDVILVSDPGMVSDPQKIVRALSGSSPRKAWIRRPGSRPQQGRQTPARGSRRGSKRKPFAEQEPRSLPFCLSGRVPCYTQIQPRIKGPAGS